jgi:AbrB family looped-hinge helix DNA binding protein
MRTEHTQIGEDGTLVIPAPFREAMGLEPGETMSIHMDEDGLHIQSVRQTIARAQAAVRSFISADRSLSDELIAERRAEAAREEANAR